MERERERRREGEKERGREGERERRREGAAIPHILSDWDLLVRAKSLQLRKSSCVCSCEHMHVCIREGCDHRERERGKKKQQLKKLN